MKELWLEYGFIKGRNGYQDMCWYNEGNASEIPHFLKQLWKWRFRKGVYFLWRYGKKSHYLKRSIALEKGEVCRHINIDWKGTREGICKDCGKSGSLQTPEGIDDDGFPSEKGEEV